MIAEQLCFDYRMKNKRGGETMYTKPEVEIGRAHV